MMKWNVSERPRGQQGQYLAAPVTGFEIPADYGKIVHPVNME